MRNDMRLNVAFSVGLTASVLGASPVERFVEALAENDAVPTEVQDLIRHEWAACVDCDEEEFLTQGLALFSEKLREGLDAYDADRFGQCADIMAGLENDKDPFVATHATAYEIKSLVALEKLLEAKARIDFLLADGGQRLGEHTYLEAEIRFLRGFCLLSDLQYGAAGRSLSRFAAEFPEAPQRLKMSAAQMLLELQNRQPERIGDVVDLMGFSGRRLTHADTGDRVRERQARIVELLDKLITEAEQQEKNSGKSGGGGNSRGQRSPQQPMPDSRLPGGEAKEGSLRESRRANPADQWGAMPPAERERVLQALRESFPSRYRQLVEQYYEELAKKP